MEGEEHKSQSVVKEAVDVKEQLEGLKDEIDSSLKHSKIKLGQTECRMQKQLKVKKLEKMSGDVQKVTLK